MAAESGESVGFSFADFQHGFSEAWDLVVPNVILILLCIFLAKFIGNFPLLWLKTQLNAVKESLKKLSEFLEETKLFGSKLLPIVVCVILGVAALDVFNYAKTWIINICPPQVVVEVDDLYAQMAPPELLLRVALKQKSITDSNQLIRYLVEWSDRIKEDKTLPGAESVSNWNDNSDEWFDYMGSVKILNADTDNALLTKPFERRTGRWWRLAWSGNIVPNDLLQILFPIKSQFMLPLVSEDEVNLIKHTGQTPAPQHSPADSISLGSKPTSSP
ncbi:MAG: hypothetical protein JO170_25995 [Verrucomicrobia bacterium]|nr:hypothetical protein [Verrucomicrobiota bacterium]